MKKDNTAPIVITSLLCFAIGYFIGKSLNDSKLKRLEEIDRSLKQADDIINNVISSSSDVSELEEQLQSAIKEEDYRKAASIRDELKKVQPI